MVKHPAIPRPSYWLVSVAAVLFGTVVVGGQHFHKAGLSLYEICLFPLLFTFLALLPGLLSHRKDLTGLSLSFFAIYGLIGALAELAQFGGVVRGVPVAVTALLLYSQPAWTLLFGKVFLNEPISKPKLFAAVLAVLGVALLVNSDTGTDKYDSKGIISALLGGLFISLWVIWGRKSGIDQRHYVVTTAAWAGFSSLWLVALWPIAVIITSDEKLTRISLVRVFEFWPSLASFALVAGVLPGLLLFKGLQSVSASTAGILLLLEPVSATLLSVALLSQRVNALIVLGGALILLANAAVVAE